MDIAVDSVSKGAEECVFLQEYEEVYTIGKSVKYQDFADYTNFAAYYIGRGGKITVHSIGQLVIYPIINLKIRDIDVFQFIWLLEQWMINVLATIRVKACKSELGRGVWVADAKIGFVGVKIIKGVSSHGLCLNVFNDLSLFSKIVPCGIKDLKVTSIKKELSKQIEMSEIKNLFIKHCPF
jgi:lipoyl(octanoyl) transferase